MSNTRGQSTAPLSSDITISSFLQENPEKVAKILRRSIVGLINTGNNKYRIALDTRELAKVPEDKVIYGNNLEELLDSIRDYKERADYSKISTHDLKYERDYDNDSYTDFIIEKRKYPLLLNLPKRVSPGDLEKLVEPFGTIKFNWNTYQEITELAKKDKYGRMLLTKNLLYIYRNKLLTTNKKTVRNERKIVQETRRKEYCLGIHMKHWDTKIRNSVHNILELSCPFDYYPGGFSWNRYRSRNWKILLASTKFTNSTKLLVKEFIPKLEYLVSNANLTKARNKKEIRVYNAIRAFTNKINSYR
jgi:hypothetical protein